jgi:hypothetical protein
VAEESIFNEFVNILKQNRQEKMQKAAATVDKKAAEGGKAAVDKKEEKEEKDKVATVDKLTTEGGSGGVVVTKKRKIMKKRKNMKTKKVKKMTVVKGKGKGGDVVDKDVDKDMDKDMDKEKDKKKGKKRQAEPQALLESLAKLRKEEHRQAFNCAERKAKVDRKRAEYKREKALLKLQTSQLASTTQKKVDVQSMLGDAVPPEQPDPRETYKRAHAADAEEHVRAQREEARTKVLADSRIILREDVKGQPPTIDSKILETIASILDKPRYGLKIELELMGFLHDRYRKVGEKLVWGWKFDGKWLCLA